MVSDSRSASLGDALFSTTTENKYELCMKKREKIPNRKVKIISRKQFNKVTAKRHKVTILYVHLLKILLIYYLIFKLSLKW